MSTKPRYPATRATMYKIQMVEAGQSRSSAAHFKQQTHMARDTCGEADTFIWVDTALWPRLFLPSQYASPSRFKSFLTQQQGNRGLVYVMDVTR